MIEPIVIMQMCALISAAPYYDCSEIWTINVYESYPPICYACVTLYDMNMYIPMNVSTYLFYHEIAHLKCKCDFHKNDSGTNDLDKVWNILFGRNHA